MISHLLNHQIFLFSIRPMKSIVKIIDQSKKNKWTWPIESLLYSLFWYSNSIEMKLEQVDLLFIFISLDSARICRYFQFNRLVPRCSIGINCHFVPPRRTLYSKSQDKKNFHYLSLITGSRLIYILSLIHIWRCRRRG